MNAMIRHAASELHPLEIVFFRSFFGFVAMLPWLTGHGIGVLRSRRPGLIGLRTLLGFISMATWFSALAIVPLGNAVALGFTAPLFAAVAAVIVLREVIRARRITALLIGFGGMLIILRPGVESVGAGEIMVVSMAGGPLVAGGVLPAAAVVPIHDGYLYMVQYVDDLLVVAIGDLPLITNGLHFIDMENAHPLLAGLDAARHQLSADSRQDAALAAEARSWERTKFFLKKTRKCDRILHTIAKVRPNFS